MMSNPFKPRRPITLREFSSDYNFDFNCTVDIYDCTSDVGNNELSWDDLASPTVSTANCNPSEIEAVDPTLLNMFVRYITVDEDRHIVIEVVESMD